MDSRTKEVIKDSWETNAGLYISSQISLEFDAFYFYTSVYLHFESSDISLKGLGKFFKDSSLKALRNAKELIDFGNKRGYKVVLKDILAVNIEEKQAPGYILEQCKTFEERSLKNLYTVSKAASEIGDRAIIVQLDNIIKRKTDLISKINYISVNIERCGNEGHEIFLFDCCLGSNTFKF